MSLKVNILLLLAVFLYVPFLHAGEKFLRVQGELIDRSTKEPITNYEVKIVQDDLDSSTTAFEKSTFDLWVQPNSETKIYFLKEGYVIDHIYIDASFIPSIAFKKKQRIEDLQIQLNKSSGSANRSKKPVVIAEYVAKINAFEVKDMTAFKRKEISPNYNPPFPSPADTYINVKPTQKSLSLTKTFNETKAKGNVGISKVLQGIIFADMNYCLFNERTNDANTYLSHLHNADKETWGAVKPFDSPEYGRIVSRTLNREQSMDTLFALGAYLETSRLILQDFTSDSKVLVHLKTLRTVLQQFAPNASSGELQEFMKGMYALTPFIDQLEIDYKEKLRNKTNFEMQQDEPFVKIKGKIDQIYQSVIQ